MKKFLSLMMLLQVGVVSAGSINIMTVDVPYRMTKVQTRFVVSPDRTSNKIAVDITRAVPGPQGTSLPAMRTTEKEVSELMVVGETLTLMAPEGSVGCGEMGTTRVLRRPVLTLSGKCEVKATVIGDKISVDLVY